MKSSEYRLGHGERVEELRRVQGFVQPIISQLNVPFEPVFQAKFRSLAK